MFALFKVIASLFGSTSTGGAEEVVTADLRLLDSADGIQEGEAQVWTPYGLSSRPAKPEGDKAGVALTVPLSGGRAILATRDPRAADSTGALNDGDVALWSVGKNAVRVNADGSLALIQQGADTDALISIDKTGAIILANQWGQIELGPSGFQVFTKDGCAIKAGGGQCQLLAEQCMITGGTVGLGPAPATPLTFLPVSGVAKAAPYVLC